MCIYVKLKLKNEASIIKEVLIEEEYFERIAKAHGNSTHVIIPKRLERKKVLVLVLDN